uniref:Uncharacterized protein n=1 Tax=Anguilla anguilla TaxID=7936 RepID=A0A0E9VTN7_ANGAN
MVNSKNQPRQIQCTACFGFLLMILFKKNVESIV